MSLSNLLWFGALLYLFGLSLEFYFLCSKRKDKKEFWECYLDEDGK